MVSEALAEFFDDEFSLVLPDNPGVTKPDFVVRGRTSCLHLRVSFVSRRVVVDKRTVAERRWCDRRPSSVEVVTNVLRVVECYPSTDVTPAAFLPLVD